MPYDEDDEVVERGKRTDKSRSPERRGRGLTKRNAPRERQDVVEDISQMILAQAAPVKPGQIYAVQYGNNGLHTDETIHEALWKGAGKLSIVAGWLGMSRATLVNRINNSEELTETLSEIEELGLDVAEIQMDALILAGNDKMIALKLKTKGKGRGWAESKQAATGNTLTLDAARELETRMVTAFAMARQMATDLTAQPKPLEIEAKAEPVAIEAAEPSDELDGDGFND